MGRISIASPSAALPRAGRRAGRGIFAWMLLACGSLVALLVVLAALILYGIAASEADLLRARQSFTQLENAHRVEAAFNRYLLGEIARRLASDRSSLESPEAGMLRGALLVSRATVGEEIASATTDAERAAERSEMSRINALTTLFRSIETDAMLDRRGLAAGAPDPEAHARAFIEGIAAPRADVFRAVVNEVIRDESDEAALAVTQLDRLRTQLLVAGGASAVIFILAGTGFAALFLRNLMRPIRVLSAAAEALPAAGPTSPMPEDLPAEFAPLARRFNEMAARIGSEQGRLQGEVAARTAELEAANAELCRIDESRRQFFADISHELRTPVTVLLGEAQIALRRPDREREALEKIAANGRFLVRRLDDLLRLARSEDGQLHLALEPLALWPAISETVEIARAYAASQEVALELATEGEGPGPMVEGNAEALRQAALALIDNAVKFSPPGGTVTLRLGSSGFAVLDTGPGFATTEPDALFARYAQGAPRGDGRGTGLGLAIVKWIADRHGATLRAEARPGGGARVGLEFPA